MAGGGRGGCSFKEAFSAMLGCSLAVLATTAQSYWPMAAYKRPFVTLCTAHEPFLFPAPILCELSFAPSAPHRITQQALRLMEGQLGNWARGHPLQSAVEDWYQRR